MFVCFFVHGHMHVINLGNLWSGERYIPEVLGRARSRRHSCTAAPVSSETTRSPAALRPASADKEPWLRSGLYPHLTENRKKDKKCGEMERKSKGGKNMARYE